MTGVIESDKYREEEATLKADPIIVAMAAEIREGIDAGAVKISDFAKDGSAVFGFMSDAGDEYRKRGGTKAESIGGPARAILALLKED